MCVANDERTKHEGVQRNQKCIGFDIVDSQFGLYAKWWIRKNNTIWLVPTQLYEYNYTYSMPKLSALSRKVSPFIGETNRLMKLFPLHEIRILWQTRDDDVIKCHRLVAAYVQWDAFGPSKRDRNNSFCFVVLFMSSVPLPRWCLGPNRCCRHICQSKLNRTQKIEMCYFVFFRSVRLRCRWRNKKVFEGVKITKSIITAAFGAINVSHAWISEYRIVWNVVLTSLSPPPTPSPLPLRPNETPNI